MHRRRETEQIELPRLQLALVGSFQEQNRAYDAQIPLEQAAYEKILFDRGIAG